MALLLAGAGACTNPIDIDTPRRLTQVNIDSLVTSPDFIRAPGDSIFARIAGHPIVFATEVQRPVFHNARLNSGYYLTVQATRYGLYGRDYELMSIRLDAIRDTGTYKVNAPYSAPKQIDSLGTPKYGASYERRVDGGFPEAFRTGDPRFGGTIRVLRIDEEHGVLVGTFSFTGHSAERDETVIVDQGAFRLRLRGR